MTACGSRPGARRWLRRAVMAGGVLASLPAAAAAADVLPPQIHTVAGGGSCKGFVTTGGACDNVRATSVPIFKAQSVAAMSDGSFLYSDYNNHLVREVTADGRVLTVAGNGTTSDAPDGTPAVQSGLDGPVSVAPVPSGGFLITEYDGSVVRYVSSLDPTTATITTIAGTGTPGGGGVLGGPGVPATTVALDYPTDAEPTPDGQVLIADRYNGYVRLLSAAAPGATVSTVAGGGSCDDRSTACEGAAAGAVALHDPVAVSPAADGSGAYLITEYGQDVVRRVGGRSPLAAVSTVAGTPGTAGFAGDGGPASAALLDHPFQAASRPDGTVAVADTGNQRVRLIAADGTITTLAGNGSAGYRGDGFNAAAASLSTPLATSLLPSGNTLIADGENNAIREVTIPPTTTVKLTPDTPDGLNGWYVSTVHITVSSSEPGTTNCVLDPGEAPPVFDAFPTPCPYAKKGADLADSGLHTLYASSANGFKDKELPVTVKLKIDKVLPTVRCAVANPTFTINDPNAAIAATVSDTFVGPLQPRVTVPVDTSQLGAATQIVTGQSIAGTVGGALCDFTVVPELFKPRPGIVSAFAASRVRGTRPPVVKRPQKGRPQTVTVAALRVTNVPRGADVRVTCTGRGCPFKVRRCPGAGCRKRARNRSGTGAVVLTSLFRGRSLPVGTRIEVAVTRDNTAGRDWRITVRGNGRAGTTVRCLPPDSASPAPFSRAKC